METLIYLSLALSALTLGISIYIASKVKAVHYLLEQPVVKKMSPQLKLKPVKLDELVADRNRQQQQNRDSRPQGGNPNGPRQGGDRGDRRPHGERPEGDRRPENRDRQGGQDRRPERSEGDRDRNRDRNRDRDRNRGDRPDRGGQDRRPREVFENRESAPVSQSVAQPVSEPAPMRAEMPASAPMMDAPLSPRRPLSSTMETESSTRQSPILPSSENEGGSENFVGSDNDMQHGRRTQMKKKPRFELDEAEVKTEG